MEIGTSFYELASQGDEEAYLRGKYLCLVCMFLTQ